ncbi:MAG TPA: nicotinate (nicotinamide) nucleotide adenylyltransferase [Candidatus Acutalibacter pullicola]|uniref:Probable nicotinate-nucleotide adenylyltransferase n=1 Tax=Candidatus Acutalibacter pullicola TaxID=2838417 RepID=A0A9D2MWA8_9FIRM|nr:nicotinate (nicotinamide) nucleotide adenylyltransferase [Candidatus Acutalibacter pullicola]
MKTGIYGGTFNPIHKGHLHIVEAFRKGLGLDRVLLIPTRVPPHKAAPDLASPQDRFAMCQLAIQGQPWLELSDMEMRREGKSYTAETLEELSALYPQDQFYLLMGEDMFLTLGRWYRPETIFSLASVCTAPRSVHGMDALREKALEYTGTFHARCFLDHIPYLPISSTQVRQAVARGEDVASLVPEAVARYIRERGLYQT